MEAVLTGGKREIRRYLRHTLFNLLPVIHGTLKCAVIILIA